MSDHEQENQGRSVGQNGFRAKGRPKSSCARSLAALAVAASVVTCGGKVTYVAVPADAGPDSAASTDAGAGSDVDGASAAPYLADPAPQSSGFQIDSAHTGATDDPSLVGAVARRWDKDFQGGVAFPLIAHGKVITTTITADEHGALQAFDAVSGASLWGPIDLGGSDIASSVYDGGQVFALTREGRLQAFDVDTGALHWTRELADPATPSQFLAAPTAHAGRVHILPNNFGAAIAVDEMTGAVAWSAPGPGAYASPAVTDTGAFLVIGCRDLYRLEPATGAVTWHHESEGCSTGMYTPVVVGSSVFIPSEIGISQFDIATGTATRPGTMIGATSSPAIQGVRVYYPLIHRLRAISLDAVTTEGSWEYEPDSGADLVVPPMVAGGHVHALWRDCTLRAFDALTGAPAWDDAEPSGCEGNAIYSGVPTSIAAAAGTIAVPYGHHLVVYGITP